MMMSGEVFWNKNLRFPIPTRNLELKYYSDKFGYLIPAHPKIGF